MVRVAAGVQTSRDPAGVGGLGQRISWLEDENAALREEQQRLEREHQRLEAERERLRGENERLRAERERLQELNERLRGEVEALRRAAKRQAAPFSKGDPVPNPKRAGRKPGAVYGTAPTGVRPSASTGSWRWGCQGAARAAAANWSWNGWRSSTRRSCRRPGHW
jgi:exonuclease VII large subunit